MWDVEITIHSEGQIGFSDIDSQGEWIGFDVEFCRAVALAIFGDSKKVKFVSTTSRSRFPILASKKIDILSRSTTWTFSRDTNLRFEFVGIIFYDGQGFIVPKSLNIENIKDLNGATICLQSGASKQFNIDNFFLNNNIKLKKLIFETQQEAINNYIQKNCDVFTDLITELSFMRTKTSEPSEHKILNEIISREPLGPVVRHGDNEWIDIVRWSLYTLILAEELNINSQNVDDKINSLNPEILRLLGVVGNYGDMVELDYNWAYNIIKNLGNYKTIFDRTIGPNTAIGLERGINNLWNNGGILYAPPFK